MTGDEDEAKVRTMFVTYQATDDAADTFMIVVGSIAENFKGVELLEYQDDSVFMDGAIAMDTLHEMLTADSRLTGEQQRLLDEFSESLNEWKDGK